MTRRKLQSAVSCTGELIFHHVKIVFENFTYLWYFKNICKVVIYRRKKRLRNSGMDDVNCWNHANIWPEISVVHREVAFELLPWPNQQWRAVTLLSLSLNTGGSKFQVINAYTRDTCTYSRPSMLEISANT